MTAGKAITAITKELKRQETETPNWHNETMHKVMHAGHYFDRVVKKAVEGGTEKEIERGIIKTVASLVRILKEMDN